MTPSEFNRLMKYAHMNDDPYGVLNVIYDNDLPHPYFNPEHIGFRKLRSFDHNIWLDRENSDRTIVYEDLEYILPGDQSPVTVWKATGTPPCDSRDILIASSITANDHLWPCEYTFSSWHLSHTCTNNRDTFVEQRDTRPYFADILLGNLKSMRTIFFELLKTNGVLEENLINAFGEYNSKFLDEGTDEIDLFFKNMDTSNTLATGSYTNTTKFFKGHFSSQFVSKHIQENTWISIVAETLTDDRIFFPTEKTGKALISGKPFIVLSGKHFLKNLRNIGFKTFGTVIDESYDDISDIHERTIAAFDSFRKLQNMDQVWVRQQLQDVLDHNEQCMRNKAWITRNARNILKKFQTPV